MKNPQQKQLQGLGPVGKMIGTGAACLTMACTGPQVRPEPPAEECPSGAVEAMEKLGIGIGDQEDAHLLLGRAGDPIFVKEGATSLRLIGPFGKLHAGSILKGRLLFGGERVYGRFIQAQEEDGTRTWPVCMELWDWDRERGLRMASGSTADTAKFWNTAKVKAVDRFTGG